MKKRSCLQFSIFNFSVLAGFLLSHSCFGQTASVIPPDQIVSQTIEHSYQLRISGQEVKATAAQYRQARAQALPALDAKAQAARYQGLENSPLGQVTIPTIEDRYSASIGITQPLFTGGRITGQKCSSLFQQSAAEQNQLATQSDITLSALTSYWNWSKAYYATLSLQAAVDRTEAHAVDMRNQHQAGMVTDNDLLSTEVQLDQTRLFLEEARNRVALTRARIEFLTGQALGENDIPVKPEVPPDTMTVTTNTETDAIARRPEKAARTLNVKASEAQVRVNKSDFFPQIALSARYEQANPNSLDFPPADEWKYDAFAGVTLSWNLLDWGLTRAKAAEASARAEQARLQLGQIEEQISLEVREARINIQDAVSRVAVAERAEKSAERNLEAATDLWQNGLARHSDVLDAMARLTDAQYQLTVTQADVVLSQAQLKHAMGQLISKDSEQHADAR
jgi:outer membrane protein